MRFKNDDGATVVLVAFATLLLLGFTALVVDVGLGFNERRQDQTAADVAVMAGALEFAGSVAEIEAQVKDLARANLTTTYTDAEWEALWTACTDPNQDEFGDFTPLPGGTTSCISASDGSYLRVKLPNQITETTFGRLLGVDQLTTSAFAISRNSPAAGGGILPFGLTGGVGAGGTCLVTGSIAIPPCDGPTTGNFGKLDSPLLGINPDLGTTRQCTGDINGRLQTNIAIGLDHQVVVHGTNPLVPDECDQTLPPNQLYVRTGNADMDPGLISNSTFGTNGTKSLLQQGSNPKRIIEDRSESLPLDNVPLWDYLASGCSSFDFTTGTEEEKFTKMSDCLQSGNPTFSAAIANSPRLAQVPRFEELTWPPGASALRTIADLPPVFLHGVYFNCTNSPSPGSCDAIFYPGEDTTAICVTPPGSCANLRVEQLTSFVLDASMLPDGVLPENGPGGSLNISEPTLFR